MRHPLSYILCNVPLQSVGLNVTLIAFVIIIIIIIKDWFHWSRRTNVYHVETSYVSTGRTCGEPQGSIIRPSQFTAYTEDIEDVIHMPRHLNVDDTQMLAKTTIQSFGTSRRHTETCIMAVQRWCATRRDPLNPDKTEFICVFCMV
jgi:hypothetical protein